MIDLDVGLLEITVGGRIDIDKLLRVAVSQWEPRTLNLYHHPVPFFKRMGHIGEVILYALHLAWCER